ncbi:MAG: hypothetical protein EOM12_15480 [Verrucomicrobiae bacterium]|nr:hypothetical protein [Verrucomicrobiae bacterium]
MEKLIGINADMECLSISEGTGGLGSVVDERSASGVTPDSAHRRVDLGTDNGSDQATVHQGAAKVVGFISPHQRQQFTKVADVRGYILRIARGSE